MSFIKKVARLLNVDPNNGQKGTDIGGFPAYSSDLVNIQENARADTLGFYEFLREHMSIADSNSSGTRIYNSKEYDSGLIVSGMQYKKIEGTNVDILPGKMYLSGEVIDYPGQTINTALGNFVWFWTGNETIGKRNFKDGNLKDATVLHGYNFAQTYNSTPPDSMLTTDNHILYKFNEIDFTDRRADVCEYYTISGALGVQQLREGHDDLGWLSAIKAGIPDVDWSAYNIRSKVIDNKESLKVSMFARTRADKITVGSWALMGDLNNTDWNQARYASSGGLYNNSSNVPVPCYFRVFNQDIEYYVDSLPDGASGADQVVFRGDFDTHTSDGVQFGRKTSTLWMKTTDSL